MYVALSLSIKISWMNEGTYFEGFWLIEKQKKKKKEKEEEEKTEDRELM